MDGFAQWLANISWPLVTGILASLGVGTITYTGADTALRSALDHVRNSFSSMTGDIFQILALSGFFDAMAIMSGGLLSGLAFLTLKHFALQTGTAS